jgi:large subunit ribosomal protein L35
MKKNKHKTKKSVAKRLRVSASGKLKMKHTNRSHMSHNKSTKQKRHLRKAGYMSKAMSKRHRYTINH